MSEKKIENTVNESSVMNVIRKWAMPILMALLVPFLVSMNSKVDQILVIVERVDNLEEKVKRLEERVDNFYEKSLDKLNNN